jgi:CheY-like chemotaxis protein
MRTPQSKATPVEASQRGIQYRRMILQRIAAQTLEGWTTIDLARDKQPDLIPMDIELPYICGLNVTRLLKP